MASQDWMNKDFYKILGVTKDASDVDIKKAYRKLARKYHPDQNPGDLATEQKFKDITEANSVLSDKQQREEYDAVRAMGSGVRFSAPGSGSSGFEDLFGGARTTTFGGSSGINFGDLFGGFGHTAPKRGEDRLATATISFAGSVTGTQIVLRVPDTGKGLTVNIPQGVKDNQKVRVSGKGYAGPAGNGDLVVTVNVSPHPFFGRKGNDILVRVPVTFPEAALGTTIEVPTVYGKTVKLKIPAGTPSGRTFRAKGKGVETKSGSGDMLIAVDIVVPQRLGGEAQKAVENFAQATAEENPRANLSAKAKL